MRHPRIQSVSEEARVTPIELFFDLVFVFSLTQVTVLMAADLDARSLLRGLMVLALLWWCWVGYAWLGNVVRADEGVGRVAMFFLLASGGDPGLRRQVLRFAPSVLGSTALLLVASQLEGPR